MKKKIEFQSGGKINTLNVEHRAFEAAAKKKRRGFGPISVIIPADKLETFIFTDQQVILKLAKKTKAGYEFPLYALFQHFNAKMARAYAAAHSGVSHAARIETENNIMRRKLDDCERFAQNVAAQERLDREADKRERIAKMLGDN